MNGRRGRKEGVKEGCGVFLFVLLRDAVYQKTERERERGKARVMVYRNPVFVWLRVSSDGVYSLGSAVD